MAKPKFDPNAAFNNIVGVPQGEPSGQQDDSVQPLQSKGRPKTDKETKKRVSLAIFPSLYDDIQKIAYVERKSISEITSQLYEKYREDNADKLKEYGKIKNI
jgi:hypothetical protein